MADARIVVVGPGAMGCLFGALFYMVGNEVILLDRDSERATLLNQRGITLDHADGRSETLPIPITCRQAEVGIADYVCICVKAYDTVSAVKSATPAMGRHTIVASVQNGMGNAEIISDHIDADRVICVATAQGANLLEPGHVVHAGEGRTVVAPFDAQGVARAAVFAAKLNQAGVGTETTDNAYDLLWRKLIINAAINPVTALYDVPNGRIIEREDLRCMACAAAEEALQVALAAGAALDVADAAAEVERVCRATSSNISSMLQDVRCGKRTEIDAINGVVVREGAQHGIDTPINRLLVDRVRQL